MTVAFSRAELVGAYNRSLASIKQLPVKTEDVVEPLERLLGTYEAVAARTRHHDAAVYVSARESRRVNRDKPARADAKQEFPYPERPGQLARGIELTSRVLAVYCDTVAREARKRCRDGPDRIDIDGRVYTLFEPVPVAAAPFMVGVEDEFMTLRRIVRQAFLYDPTTQTNPDTGLFSDTVLLSGPPGTGKSTLVRALHAEAHRASALSGTPYRFASYDASAFSSYFGQSTRILKRMLRQTRADDGVGVFVIEDADMVLQSRDEEHKSHGILELQQLLMNELSGLRPSRGNALTVLTTNKPDAIDDALRSRVHLQLTIDPFKRRETHDAYWTARAAHLTPHDHAVVARASHDAGLAGRDLDAVLRAAQAEITMEPSDAELRARARAVPLAKPALDAYVSAIAARRRV